MSGFIERHQRMRFVEQSHIDVLDCGAGCRTIHVLTIRVEGDGGLQHVVEPRPMNRRVFYTCPVTGVETFTVARLAAGAVTVLSVDAPASRAEKPRTGKKRHG